MSSQATELKSDLVKSSVPTATGPMTRLSPKINFGIYFIFIDISSTINFINTISLGIEATDQGRKVFLQRNLLESESCFLYQEPICGSKVRIVGPATKQTIVSNEPPNVSQHRRKHVRQEAEEQISNDGTSTANGRTVLTAYPKERSVRELSKTVRHFNSIHSHFLQIILNSFLQIKCSVCFKTFLKQVYLDRHMVSHRPVIKKYLCPICQQSCESRSNLKTHGRTKHDVVFNNDQMIEADFINDDPN